MERQKSAPEKNEKNTKEPIYKSGCWTCKRALEDPTEKYICPKLEQHLIDYEIYSAKQQWIKGEDSSPSGISTSLKPLKKSSSGVRKNN